MCAAQKKRISSGPSLAQGVGTSSTVAPSSVNRADRFLHQRRHFGIDAGAWPRSGL